MREMIRLEERGFFDYRECRRRGAGVSERFRERAFYACKHERLFAVFRID